MSGGIAIMSLFVSVWAGFINDRAEIFVFPVFSRESLTARFEAGGIFDV
jgi:hypothetical protein